MFFIVVIGFLTFFVFPIMLLIMGALENLSSGATYGVLGLGQVALLFMGGWELLPYMLFFDFLIFLAYIFNSD